MMTRLILFLAIIAVVSSSPTTKPTTQPSKASSNPTIRPTLATSLKPTTTPSVVPSTAPTLLPTFTPSARPTTDPTAKPTIMPSATPTTAPSGVPSPSPTVIATVQPSVIPTLSPSFTPAPSAPPTKQTSPIVIFFTNITLSGAAQSYIDADGLNVVALTVANTWNFPSNAVRSLGYAQAFNPSNSATSASDGNRNLRTLSPVEVLSTTYTLIAILKTSVALSATQYASDEVLYSTSVSTLSAQINNGQFSTNLQINAQTAGATDLFNANATNAVSSDYTTAYSGAGSTTSGLSSGETAGVVISILFVSFVVAYFAYRRYSASSASQPAPGARGYVVSEDDDYVENPVHTFGENEELRDSRKVHVNDLNML